MKNLVFFITLSISITSCFKGNKVDLIIHNARIHSMNTTDDEFQAMAIKDGKILELGPERQILNKYRSDEEIDAYGKNVYPGFTDAHTHLLSLAQERLSANLKDAKTPEQVAVMLEKYASRNNRSFIIGRGIQWDNIHQYEELARIISRSFPNIPVFIITKDIHSAILNQKAIELLKLPTTSGIISENAFFEAYSKFPKFSQSELQKQLFELQDELLQFGIVAVHEMGWSHEDYQFFKSLTKNNKWKINISAYLLPSKENLHLLKNGIIRGEKLQIRGLKILLDGTFSSRTALLSSSYVDGSSGKINYSTISLDSLLLFAHDHELQLAAHAAGDVSAELFLKRVKSLQLNVDNLKWRIEHLQKTNPTILSLLSELHIIPSIQPYQAVSDAAWIRLAIQPVDNSFYAYKSLLAANGIIGIGSDLPVETYNPFEIIWASNTRKDIENKGYGFNEIEKLNIKDALKAYTIYNAQLTDNDTEYGTIEKGKAATFFISEYPINSDFNSIYNYSNWTFIKSKKVYSVE